MAKGFGDYTIALLIVGLFAVMIITGGIMMASQNDFAGSIGNDPAISAYADSIQGALNNATEASQSSDAVLSNSSITTSTSFPFIDSISGIWKTVKGATVVVWNLTLGLALEKIFGANKVIVLNVLGAIFGLILIFGVIYFISTGKARGDQ